MEKQKTDNKRWGWCKRGVEVLFYSTISARRKSPGMLFCLHLTWYKRNTHTHVHTQTSHTKNLYSGWVTNGRREGIKLEAVEIPNAHPSSTHASFTHTHTHTRICTQTAILLCSLCLVVLLCLWLHIYQPLSHPGSSDAAVKGRVTC